MPAETWKNILSMLKTAGILSLLGALLGATPASAVDFLGATLCRDHATAAVSIPEDSGLRLASVEIGDENGLLMLLYATEGGALEHLDALMTRVTGRPGERDGDSIQWSGHTILAYASLVKKGTVAMAVSSDDNCSSTPGLVIPPAIPLESPHPVAAPEAPEAPTFGASAPVAPVVATGSPKETTAHLGEEHEAPALDTEVDFQLQGELQYAEATPPWVDVMGVLHNLSSKDYRLAAFDLSLYDEQGDLICVDTISIGMLKADQTRAFRDSLNCPSYRRGRVAKYRLQLSGGY